MVGTRQCRGRSRLAAATSALLVGLQCRRLGELLVVFLSDGLLDGFLAMAHAGVELAAPAPRAEAVLQPTLSHPPQHEPGRRALERRFMICCAVECVRGGVHGGVACDSALRPVMVALATALEQLHAQ